MSIAAHPFSQHKIVILNPKGGSGKTTLATNLASFYATHGPPPILVDCDPGGFSLRWIDKRHPNRPPVHGICGYDQDLSIAEQIAQYPESKEIIVDLPAAQDPQQIFDHVYDATSIIIPIVPSEIDIYAAAKFIADLLLFTQLDRRKKNLAIVANRVRQNTKSYRRLRRFLTSLDIPVIARLRDSQNFVQAAAFGIGISELPPHKVRPDLDQLDLITNWLDRWRMRQLDALIAEEIRRAPEREGTAPAVALRH